MIRSPLLKTFICCTIAVTGTTFSPASALEIPIFNAKIDIAPPDSVPSAPYPMTQSEKCAISLVMEKSQFKTIPINSVWDTTDLHNFATGKGITVGVIDSGVTPNPRLPSLTGGGDYINGKNGLEDCDHHGTLIAGLIGAKGSPNDGFIGVAPNVHLISIRQMSAAYEAADYKQRVSPDEAHKHDIETLAKAIVHAADLGAKVINVSITACDAATHRPQVTDELFGAIYHAAVVKDAVVVTAAGNTGEACSTNPGPSADYPDDPRGWKTVQTVSYPSVFSNLVLSVGGSTLTGDPYVNSMPGPWVGVAAPAVNVVSLDPTVSSKVGLVNGQQGRDGVKPLNGTSFSSAIVAGLAALIREKYPRLSSHQVINRIKNSSHAVDKTLQSVMGVGNVDPMAALTADLPDGDVLDASVPSVGVAMAPPPPPKDTLPQKVALISGGSALIIFIFSTLIYALVRRRNEVV